MKAYQFPEEDIAATIAAESSTPSYAFPEEDIKATADELDGPELLEFSKQSPEAFEAAFQRDKRLSERPLGEKAKEFVGEAASLSALGRGVSSLWGFATAPARIAYDRVAQTYYGLTDDPRAKTKQAEATLSGQMAEEGTRSLFNLLSMKGGPPAMEIDGEEVRVTPEDQQAIEAVQGKNERFEREAFGRKVEAYKRSAQLAEGNPLDTGAVAAIYKMGGQLPSTEVGPESLTAEGAPPVNMSQVQANASFASPANLLLPIGSVVPGARQIAGGAAELAGGAMRLPAMALSKLPPGALAKIPKVGPALKGAGGAGLVMGTVMHGPEVAAGVIGAAIVGKTLQKTLKPGGLLERGGSLLQQQGRELRTGQASPLTTRIATARATGEGAKKLDVAGRNAADTAIAGAQTAIGLAPLNVALSEGDGEAFTEMTANAFGFGGLARLGSSGRRMLVEGVKPHLRSEGARTIDGNDPLGRKTAEFVMSIPDAPRDRILQTIGAFQGLPTASGGKAKVHVLREADYLAELAKVTKDTPEGGGDGFAVGADGTIYINGEHTAATGRDSQIIGHEFGHIAELVVKAMGHKGAPLWEGVMKSVREGLYDKDGKTTEDFKKFVEGYNKAFDPTGETQRYDPSDPKAAEEYLAEVSGSILAGDGIAEYALPKTMADKVNDAIGGFTAKMLGFTPGKDGTPTRWNRKDVEAITDSWKDLVRGVAAEALRGPRRENVPDLPPEPASGNVARPAGTPEPPPIPGSPPVNPQARETLLRENILRGMFSGTNVEKANEQLSRMQDKSAPWSADLQALPQSLHAELQRDAQAIADTAKEGQREALRAGVFKAGQTIEETLRALRGAELTNASPGLRQAVASGVVVPPLSPKGAQAGPIIPEGLLDAMRDHHVAPEGMEPRTQRANSQRGVAGKSADAIAAERAAEFDAMAESYQQNLAESGEAPPGNPIELYQAILEHALRQNPRESVPPPVTSINRREDFPEVSLVGKESQMPPPETVLKEPGGSEPPLPAPESVLRPPAETPPTIQINTGDRVAEVPRGQKTPKTVSPEEVQHRMDAARAKARASTPWKRARNKQAVEDKASEVALMESVHESGSHDPSLMQRRIGDDGKVTYSGRIDPSLPAHRILLDRLKPSQRGVLEKMNENLGKVVHIDYGSAEKINYGEAEGYEESGKQRKVEYAESPAEDRASGRDELLEQGKAFMPLGTKYNPGTRSVTVFGFSPDRLLSNAQKIIEYMQAKKLKPGYTGANDPQLVADMNGYAQNHGANFRGDGSGVVKGARTDPGYVPYVIPRNRFDILNAAMHKDISTKSGSKRPETVEKALEAQNLAAINEWYVGDQTGDTNPLRDLINKSGKFKSKKATGTAEVLEPVFESLRPELVLAFKDAPKPTDVSVRPSGFKGDAGDIVASGLPKTSYVEAGFSPRDPTRPALPKDRTRLDQEYLKAAESGDTETAQRIANEAAKESGYGILAAHSTNAGDFNEFRTSGLSAHFGTDKSAQDRAETLRYFSEEVVGRAHAKARVIPVALKVESPLVMPDLAGIDVLSGLPMRQATKEFRQKYATKRERDRAEETGEAPRHGAWESETDFAEQLVRMGEITRDEFWDVQYDPDAAVELLKTKGYDGIKYRNDVEDAGSDSYVVFDPSQVKRRDITRDDKGRIIPLSERFNTQSNDIRFSPKDPTKLTLPNERTEPTTGERAAETQRGAAEGGDQETGAERRGDRPGQSPPGGAAKVPGRPREPAVASLEAQFSPSEQAGASKQEIAKAKKAWREQGTKSPWFQRWFRSSQILNEDGSPRIVHHGRLRKFDAFDKAKATPYSDLGEGFYFSSERLDSERNYADMENSPDWQQKIALRAEEISQSGEGDINYKDALKQAESEISDGTSEVLDLYLKIEKPLVLLEKAGTIFELGYEIPREFKLREIEETGEAVIEDAKTGKEIERFDDVGDALSEYERESGNGIDLKNAIDRAGRSMKFDGESLWEWITGGFQEANSDNAYTRRGRPAQLEDGIPAHEVIEAIKSWDGAYELEQGPPSLIAPIFREMGFDGIHIKNAEQRYPGISMGKDTDHFVVWEPTQVKHIRNKGTFDESDPRFMFAAKDKTKLKLPNEEETSQGVRAYPEDPRRGKVSSAERPPKVLGPNVSREDGWRPWAHWSRKSDLTEFDPAKHGTGAAGAETSRATIPRTYIGFGKYQREPGIGYNRYTGDLDFNLLYDIEKDPLDLYTLSEERLTALNAKKPYKTRASVAQIATEMEKLVKEHGFLGLLNTKHQAAALFHPIPAGGKVGVEEFQISAPDYARRSPDEVRQFFEKDPGGEYKPAYSPADGTKLEIPFESTPGRRQKIIQSLNDAPFEERQKWHKVVSGILFGEKGKELADSMGLEIESIPGGVGSYVEGGRIDNNPLEIVEVGGLRKSKSGLVLPDDLSKLEAYASILGNSARQNSVAWSNMLPAGPDAPFDSHYLIAGEGRLLKLEEVNTLLSGVSKKLGIDPSEMAVVADKMGARILNFSDKTPEAMQEAVLDIASGIFDELSLAESHHQGNLIEDHQYEPKVQSYHLQGGGASRGSSTTKSQANNLYDAVQKAAEDFSEERGWGDAGYPGEGPIARFSPTSINRREKMLRPALDELYSRHDPNLDAYVSIMENTDRKGRLILKLDSMQARKAAPRGAGTAFMEDLIRLADENNAVLTLQTATRGDLTGDREFKQTSSQDRLKSFYSRFGFKPNNGKRSYRPELPGSMHRNPEGDFSPRDDSLLRPALAEDGTILHTGIMGDTHAKLHGEAAKKDIDTSTAEHVFTDGSGRILTREQAYPIAEEQGQLNEEGAKKRLRAEAAGKKPVLESQDLRAAPDTSGQKGKQALVLPEYEGD